MTTTGRRHHPRHRKDDDDARHYHHHGKRQDNDDGTVAPPIPPKRRRRRRVTTAPPPPHHRVDDDGTMAPPVPPKRRVTTAPHDGIMSIARGRGKVVERAWRMYHRRSADRLAALTSPNHRLPTHHFSEATWTNLGRIVTAETTAALVPVLVRAARKVCNQELQITAA